MNIMKKKIAIFTGNRAEYGLQYPIIKALQENKDIDLRLLVSGAHLDENFGKTLQEIKQDGFNIHTEIKIEMDEDSNIATPLAISSGVKLISEALNKIKPDFFVVYADRFEGFAAVIASSQMNIPTAHIEGGDITEGGALDDSVRHAMTKLSHLHFTTNEEASRRVIAMGEEEWRVHTVGFPAIDLIEERNFASPEEVSRDLGISLDIPIVLFTQHSVTTEFDLASNQIEPSLRALETLSKEGVQVIITYPNNDAGGRSIIKKIKQIKPSKNLKVYSSLGRYLYHGVLALAEDSERLILCAGNSSSGIKETPVFGCPTINIGSRQEGRLRGDNVIDTTYDSTEIYDAAIKCFYDKTFRLRCKNTVNPYYLGGAGRKIVEILLKTEFNQALLRKSMTLKAEKLI